MMNKLSENTGPVPEFIQKLFGMLANDRLQDILSWGIDGTTFIVKDTNLFSKTILPKHFKHGNFASFVRQLNKYDFHKIRHNEDEVRLYGDQAWEFVHPQFLRGRKDLLPHIKRKTSNYKPKKLQRESSFAFNQQQFQQQEGHAKTLEEIRDVGLHLQRQIDQLCQSRRVIEERILEMEQNDSQIMSELSNLNTSLKQKDDLIKEFVDLMKSSRSRLYHQTAGTHCNDQELQKDFNQLLEKFHNIYSMESSSSNSNKRIDQNFNEQQRTGLGKPLHKSLRRVQTQKPSSIPMESDTITAAAAAANMNAGSLIGSPVKTADGLAFVTLGRLSANMAVRDNKPAIEIMAADQTPTIASSTKSTTSTSYVNGRIQGLKRKQPDDTVKTTEATTSLTTKVDCTSPFTPTTAAGDLTSSNNGWTVPPRILLVDDDSVYRDLSGKLLKVFGCTIDLAKDGTEALKKMGLEKYDLILMDIVMPKMDGISATRNIRQYDALTPIISMTSNFSHNDILQYIGSGMTDILPKPFSKRTLFQMLDKYCAHLKAIQQVHGIDITLAHAAALPPVALDDISSVFFIDNTTATTANNKREDNDGHFPVKTPKDHDDKTGSSHNVSAGTTSTATTANTINNAITTTTNVFPLAPYPYPVTMNSVSADDGLNTSSNSMHDKKEAIPNGHVYFDMPKVTFWPQQTAQQHHPPPAIVPTTAGKFQWAVPTTVNEIQSGAFPVGPPSNPKLANESNKKPKLL
ncbi:hypothetical protein BDF20DRAFT_897018 [Mycotypha africana]|uniref:uncharacterized protein n=1 Tax=Mycotypha africana TaxID=64632 RepID=UPI00230027B4|nr:uncharacterized protein BDF20DRAFT_897018 [Mycotypha africana]KAI8968554.1 hypothetical protein BDF20DRAFT_897018 [Mycotypha africana]